VGLHSVCAVFCGRCEVSVTGSLHSVCAVFGVRCEVSVTGSLHILCGHIISALYSCNFESLLNNKVTLLNQYLRPPDLYEFWKHKSLNLNKGARSFTR
jgi:hypothetical protein